MIRREVKYEHLFNGLIGLLGICVGAIIGLGIDFKINHTYKLIGMQSGT